MVNIDPLKIAQRRREIDEQVAHLQKEGEELDIAMRVFQRLAGEETRKTVIEDILDPGTAPRPDGTPTNFEMVEFVLAGAERDGRDGLTGSELVDEIAQQYWPGLVGKQILPSIYQFAKKGRLKKTSGGKFKRVAKTVAAQLEEMGVPTSDDAPAHIFRPERAK